MRTDLSRAPDGDGPRLAVAIRAPTLDRPKWAEVPGANGHGAGDTVFSIALSSSAEPGFWLFFELKPPSADVQCDLSQSRKKDPPFASVWGV
ncbi:hypothetical protein TBK1r_60860 [Stieleria magnilauensis]|uniref:Uncharacterized protein n=1 Tax=Stieleria magnilauensis TaxID=2527963 RepID=A0ABX5XYF0_9BACT|nr:hypothetical protein TBK1r_60860 [Planctomycetes bacterium TBK1r]